MSELETRVVRGWSQPTIVTRDGSRPTSSCASRRAAAVVSSPASSRPPGKLTCPWWVRSSVERRVKTILACPSSSNSGTSTPAFAWVGHG